MCFQGSEPPPMLLLKCTLMDKTRKQSESPSCCVDTTSIFMFTVFCPVFVLCIISGSLSRQVCFQTKKYMYYKIIDIYNLYLGLNVGTHKVMDRIKNQPSRGAREGRSSFCVFNFGFEHLDLEDYPELQGPLSLLQFGEQ